MALGRPVAAETARHSAPIVSPLRRGTAAAVVSGGALTLAGVAAAIPASFDAAPATVPAGMVAAAALLPAEPVVAADRAPAETAPDRPTLVPVAAPAAAEIAAETERLDTAKLVKAVQLAERQAAGARGRSAEDDDDPEPDDAAERDSKPAQDTDTDRDEPSTRTAGTDCGVDTSELGAVKAHVRSAGLFLGCRFGEPTMYGVSGRAGTSDHPSGKAIDFMVDRATGDALAACTLRNQEALGVSYVIWKQRINFGSGWEPMEDRGGVTANHFDHVHVSFDTAAGGRPRSC